MKLKFSGIPERVVEITHGEQTVAITLHPLPFGYADMIERVYPAPVKFVNAKPVPDESAVAEWNTHRVLFRVAKAMGAQLDAVAPVDGDRAAWARYAAELQAEFVAANFLQDDLYVLGLALNELNAGKGALGKA